MGGWCRAVASLLMIGCVASCGGQGEYRKTGGTFAGRGPQCDYRVIRNRAVEPYEEIGVIDIDAFSNKQLPRDEEQFRRVVGPTVCAAGGEAVIPAIDIYGHWIHGTIVRFHPTQCVGCEPKPPQKEGG